MISPSSESFSESEPGRRAASQGNPQAPPAISPPHPTAGWSAPAAALRHAWTRDAAIFTIVFLSWLAPDSVFAQGGAEKDLLAGFDPAKGTVAGRWTRTKDGFGVEPDRAARSVLATNITGDYTLTVEFTRSQGNDSVALILPVGNVSPALELGSWQGEAHGLSRVDGLSSRDQKNPTSTRPGVIQNGRRQRVEVNVSTSGGTAAITAKLNGQPMFQWNGPVARLQPNLALNLPSPNALGLAAHNCGVVFHRAVLRTEGKPSPTVTKPATPRSQPATKSGAGSDFDLAALGRNGTPGWEPFNEAAFTTATENGRTILRSQPGTGSADRGAYITGLPFSEGVIEIDLKGANRPGGSFVGVVFHGVDGRAYDAVYFRPFNFGQADPVRRSHAVQYMSHPDWPWDRLRAERNGQFEKRAIPEPGANDWFHARIEVAGQRVRVFVSGAKQPCLDVGKLSQSNSGKVGLWFNGIASFANLKIEPAK